MVYPRDISQKARQLFLRELDTLRQFQDNSPTLDANSSGSFYDRASFFYYHEGQKYIRFNFGRIGGISCGYREDDEPHKITVTNSKGIKKAGALYDYEDSTVWISSANWKTDTIRIYFRKGFLPLTKLIFFTGDQTSEKNWLHFSRPREMKVLVNGRPWGFLHFADEISRQEFEFEEIKNDRKNVVITLLITRIYTGKSQRVAISDIDFDGVLVP